MGEITSGDPQLGGDDWDQASWMDGCGFQAHPG